jgi:hypothetical protein
MTTLSTESSERAAPQRGSPPGTASAAAGLLSDEELIGAMRAALPGYVISDAQLQDAVNAIRAAEAVKWEQLPPEIDQDMGYHYRFLSCSETCWLGRKVLIEGETFRVFRQRAQ